jgi:hypothetical protein
MYFEKIHNKGTGQALQKPVPGDADENASTGDLGYLFAHNGLYVVLQRQSC